MVTIGMNYDVLPGKETLFEEKFQAVLKSFGEGSGHVVTRLYRDVSDSSAYLIHSEWETRDAFMAFIRSDEFRAVTNWGKEEILADRPRHRIYGEEAHT
ncbi:MAG: hypothetical protein DHS20C21_23420 [Gemmatimonadota bacterium]|nr:MAG: hypothetical protein DHS20C21_23420 [Gemmatimonadota bacterium]